MEVVAEGVETQEQLEMLRELKCDQTQGFLLAKPMLGADFIQLLNAPPGNHADDIGGRIVNAASAGMM
jgi:EAL domain-containing protein (putative c-di-GMP-specific phosphodiesterase class I)